MARSTVIVAVICTIPVPRNKTHWLGDSRLLAKLTLSPRQSKWLKMRVLCDVKPTCDWARMSQLSRNLSMQIPICRRGERAASMHRVKVWRAREDLNVFTAHCCGEHTAEAHGL